MAITSMKTNTNKSDKRKEITNRIHSIYRELNENAVKIKNLSKSVKSLKRVRITDPKFLEVVDYYAKSLENALKERQRLIDECEELSMKLLSIYEEEE